jgi:DNA-binding beta-propeller fold protein YncE
MYIIGTNQDTVFEYNLGTAWDISTASYLQGFSVAAQGTSPTELFFKPDGTKMYIIEAAGDDVNEYDLGTAWNVSTASFLQLFSIATEEINPSGIFFKPDGLKMYITGTTSDAVHEYDLGTAWDISTASFVQNFSVATEDGTPQGMFFKPDGAKMYILGSTNDVVYQYSTVSSSNTTPTVAWPESITWETGSAPTLPDLGQTDVLEFYTSDGGTTYYGKLKEDNVS